MDVVSDCSDAPMTPLRVGGFVPYQASHPFGFVEKGSINATGTTVDVGAESPISPVTAGGYKFLDKPVAAMLRNMGCGAGWKM